VYVVERFKNHGIEATCIQVSGNAFLERIAVLVEPIQELSTFMWRERIDGLLNLLNST
jgi:hypothetical protein